MQVQNILPLSMRPKSPAEFRAWCYFAFSLIAISWQAFSVAPISNAINLSHFAKHALAMTFLSGLLHYALQMRGTMTPAAARVCIFFSILAYGLFIEFVHWHLPWRSAEVIDVVADLVGIVLYLVAYAILQKTAFWRKIGGY